MPEISEDDLKAFNDSKSIIEDLNSQIGKVNGKNEELLGEKKKAQAAQAKADEEASTAKNDKLKASGDFEELLKSTTAELEKEREMNRVNSAREAQKEINLSSLQLAGKLANGDNIDLLAKFVTERLKFSDGVVKVLNKEGELTISTLDDLKNEIQSDVRFASLLKGVQSSGGGANGGDNGGGAANNKLNSTQRIAEGLKEL